MSTSISGTVGLRGAAAGGGRTLFVFPSSIAVPSLIELVSLLLGEPGLQPLACLPLFLDTPHHLLVSLLRWLAIPGVHLSLPCCLNALDALGEFFWGQHGWRPPLRVQKALALLEAGQIDLARLPVNQQEMPGQSLSPDGR